MVIEIVTMVVAVALIAHAAHPSPHHPVDVAVTPLEALPVAAILISLVIGVLLDAMTDDAELLAVRPR